MRHVGERSKDRREEERGSHLGRGRAASVILVAALAAHDDDDGNEDNDDTTGEKFRPLLDKYTWS